MSTPAGYSKRTLAEKLGIKAGQRVYIDGAPDGYISDTLGALPAEVTLLHDLDGAFDLMQAFAVSTAEPRGIFPTLKGHLSQKGSLWISWKKGGAKSGSDLNENIVREIGLDVGLVDVKVAAVDHTWSGLKFVFRRKDRD